MAHKLPSSPFFHCGARLMSHCTPLTDSCLWFCCAFSLLLPSGFGSGFGPLFVLVLVWFSCLLCFSAIPPVDHAQDIILDILSMLAREAPTSVSASFALISTASKNLYNDQAEAIVALEKKKSLFALSRQFGLFSCFFFCSNALIALARSLCKCLLAQLITASGANAVKGYLVRCACIDGTIP